MTPDDPLQRFRLNRCINCGYDLRGSWDSERCSECEYYCRHALLVQRSRPWRYVVMPLVLALLVLILAAMVLFRGDREMALVLIPLLALLMVGAVLVRPRNGVSRLDRPILITRDGIVHWDVRRQGEIPWRGLRGGEVTQISETLRRRGDHAICDWRLEIQLWDETEWMYTEVTGTHPTLSVEFDATHVEARAVCDELERRIRKAHPTDDA